jgi:predicted nucleic acid-binding protein
VIVLDTNVVSEAMRPRPDARVVDWLDAQTSSVMITSVTVAEILFGIRMLSDGRRRADLQTAFELFMRQGMRSQVLEFDHAAAESYSWIAADRQRSGRAWQPSAA